MKNCNKCCGRIVSKCCPGTFDCQAERSEAFIFRKLSSGKANGNNLIGKS